MGADGTVSGWLTDDGSTLIEILGGDSRHWIDWQTAEFEPGDVVILHPDLLHMTAANCSTKFRISCDTRWQLPSQQSKPSMVGWKVLSAT